MKNKAAKGWDTPRTFGNGISQVDASIFKTPTTKSVYQEELSIGGNPSYSQSEVGKIIANSNSYTALQDDAYHNPSVGNDNGISKVKGASTQSDMLMTTDKPLNSSSSIGKLSKIESVSKPDVITDASRVLDKQQQYYDNNGNLQDVSSFDDDMGDTTAFADTQKQQVPTYGGIQTNSVQPEVGNTQQPVQQSTGSDGQTSTVINKTEYNNLEKAQIGMAIVKDITTAWSAWKNNKIMKEQFTFNKEMAQKNYDLTKDSYTRRRKRASNVTKQLRGQSFERVASDMDKWNSNRASTDQSLDSRSDAKRRAKSKESIKRVGKRTTTNNKDRKLKRI